MISNSNRPVILLSEQPICSFRHHRLWGHWPLSWYFPRPNSIADDICRSNFYADSATHVACMGKRIFYLYHLPHLYRVTRLLVQNLPLTSKVKFRFGLAWPGQARPKRNFTFWSQREVLKEMGHPVQQDSLIFLHLLKSLKYMYEWEPIYYSCTLVLRSYNT